MIKEFPCFTVICDGCKRDANDGGDYSGYTTPEDAHEIANHDDWREFNGKDYCFDCQEFDEVNDEWKPKEGLNAE